MNPNDFRSPEAGQVILTQNGYHAFIPALLPPKLVRNLPKLAFYEKSLGTPATKSIAPMKYLA